MSLLREGFTGQGAAEAELRFAQDARCGRGRRDQTWMDA